MVGLRSCLTIAVFGMAACSQQPKRETYAIVVSIAPGPSGKWDTDKVVVTARSPDGVVGMKWVAKRQFRCRVGDTLRATIQGTALTLDDGACVT